MPVSKKYKRWWTHTHIHPCQGGPARRVTWTLCVKHGVWRAASLIAPGEAEMMDKVCRWEWTLQAQGHRRSTPIPPLPSVSTGWAPTHNHARGRTHQDHLQQHSPHFSSEAGRSERHTGKLSILQFNPFLLSSNDSYIHTNSRIDHHSEFSVHLRGAKHAFFISNSGRGKRNVCRVPSPPSWVISFRKYTNKVKASHIETDTSFKWKYLVMISLV